MNNKNFQYITTLLLIFVFSAAPVFAKTEIKEGSTLSLNECIDIAIDNSPRINIYEEYIKIYDSRKGQSKAAYFPKLGASAGYEYGNTDSTVRNSHSRTGTARVALNQLIYSFGKVWSKVKMQKFYKIAAEYDLDNEILNVTATVKNKYYAVLAAKANLEVQKANVAVNERQYERTKAFYEEGMVSKIDLVNEEVYLSDARIALTNAENLYENAVIALNSAMSLRKAPEYNIESTETFNLKDNYAEMNLLNIANTKTNEDGTIEPSAAVLTTQVEKTDIIDNYVFKKYPYTLEESIERAYEQRPDLHSLEAARDAANESLKYTKKEYFPDLTGSVGYNWNNNSYYSTNGVSAGVFLTMNNLNIMETKLRVDESKSQLEIAEQNVDAIKDEIYFEVQNAYVNMIQLEKNIPLMRTKVKQTLENYELADARYEVGLGNFIELQDAKVNYNNAQQDYIKAIFNYNTALTELQKAMGDKQ